MAVEEHELLLSRPDWFELSEKTFLESLINLGYPKVEICQFCKGPRVIATSDTTGCCEEERQRYRNKRILQLLREDTPLEDFLTSDNEFFREIGLWLQRRLKET